MVEHDESSARERWDNIAQPFGILPFLDDRNALLCCTSVEDQDALCSMSSESPRKCRTSLTLASSNQLYVQRHA